MTERIKELLEILKSGSYKSRRSSREIVLTPEEEALSPFMKDAILLKTTLEAEEPHLLKGDRIGFNRSNITGYSGFSQYDLEYRWALGNIVPDYEKFLNHGMDSVKEEIKMRLTTCSQDQQEFLEAALLCVDSVLSFTDRYCAAAQTAGADALHSCLCRVPRQGASTLLEACVFLKLIIFTLRCNYCTHITLGRFDKYMRPFYQADLAAGMTREALLEIIEEFFISINFDTDLYQGVQQGDNGQSLVLGGCGSFDDFSHLCMEAALELNLIDPKINLRVDNDTPDALYEYATLMTKQGMGFPQYCNDDIVIPGLIRLGYTPEDAADYAVAACWEFIIPGKGMDVPNIIVMNFPKVIGDTIQSHLLDSISFEELLQKAKASIITECDRLMEASRAFHLKPSPYLSVFVEGCLASGRDITQQGAIYNNYGCHGAGISTAADSLAAIREVIFETKEYTKQELLDALNNDFAGFDALRNRLLGCPKMGNGDSRVDSLGYFLMDCFSGYLNNKPNPVGGIFRAGTGSAHEYWYSARNVGATADGRHAYQPYGCSFSPSLEARLSGPLSCIRSFTGYDLTKISNGGPLTLEIHDTVFRNDQGIRKVAQLVKAFITLGGHQLQLNCVNRDVLLDALEHPEDHKNLIVRVWGWSGYFNELELPFQEHIIKRTEFTV